MDCDNKATIDIAHNLVQHDRTEYVEVDRHFMIKVILEVGLIYVPFFEFEYQLADVLTKVVFSKVDHSSLELAIGHIYAPFFFL